MKKIILVLILSLMLTGCSQDKYSSNSQDVFHGYKCTSNCSGHQAGWDWAEKKGIYNASDCGGKSTSFIEGCKAYANNN